MVAGFGGIGRRSCRSIQDAGDGRRNTGRDASLRGFGVTPWPSLSSTQCRSRTGVTQSTFAVADFFSALPKPTMPVATFCVVFAFLVLFSRCRPTFTSACKDGTDGDRGHGCFSTTSCGADRVSEPTARRSSCVCSRYRRADPRRTQRRQSAAQTVDRAEGGTHRPTVDLTDDRPSVPRISCFGKRLGENLVVDRPLWRGNDVPA